MSTVTKHAEKEEVVMSFTKDVLLGQIHTEAGNDFPGPSLLLLGGENLWALKQKELESFFASAALSHTFV